MLKYILGILVLTLGAAIAMSTMNGSYAQSPISAATTTDVPKAFGTFRAVSGRGLIFEATDGTLRVIDIASGRLMGITRK
jgi:hypothetical protein